MDGSDDIRRKLRSLNRGPLPPAEGDSGDLRGLRRKIRKLRQQDRQARDQPIYYSRDVPRRPPQPRASRPPRGTPSRLEDAIRGREVASPCGGRLYLVEARLAELQEQPAGLREDFPRALARPDSNLRRRLAALCGAEGPRPEDVLFLDLETTGLSGGPLFLIGTMAWRDGDLAVRQYFARDYSEEAATIALLSRALAGSRLLVSFNGKSFDLPYARVRAAATGVALAAEPPHFDLLHECRRAWGRVLPNCRLQTLEDRICGRLRHGDIPGAEIPDAYHAFVRTGDARQIADILRHNMFDLFTMADLMTRFPPPAQ